MSDAPLAKSEKIVMPGSLLAILGGGQLGRMTAIAARTMGYRVRVMDPEPACPASFVADETIVGRWDDVDAARRLAAGAAAVTLEIEQIGVEALGEVARLAPLRPGVEPIRIIQDKTLQKTWLAENGFPVGPFRVVRSEKEVEEAVAALGGDVFLKIGRGGYDGRGQVRVGAVEPEIPSPVSKSRPGAPNHLGEAMRLVSAGPCVAEQALDLECEISVMARAIRRAKFALLLRRAIITKIRSWPGACFRRACNRELESRAEALAAATDCETRHGRIAVRGTFRHAEGELLVNELAPRPHNSYHQSERGCVTSQFEQLVRAVCNLPLGRPS